MFRAQHIPWRAIATIFVVCSFSIFLGGCEIQGGALADSVSIDWYENEVHFSIAGVLLNILFGALLAFGLTRMVQQSPPQAKKIELIWRNTLWILGIWSVIVQVMAAFLVFTSKHVATQAFASVFLALIVVLQNIFTAVTAPVWLLLPEISNNIYAPEGNIIHFCYVVAVIVLAHVAYLRRKRKR